MRHSQLSGKKGDCKSHCQKPQQPTQQSKQSNTFSHPFAAAVGEARDWLLMQVCVTQGISDFLWTIFRAAASIDTIQSSHFFFFTTPGTNTYWCTGSLRVNFSQRFPLLPGACWFEGQDTSLKPAYVITLDMWNHVVVSPPSEVCTTSQHNREALLC